MTRPPFERVAEIAAYCYRADLYCPACVVEEMIAARDAAPAAHDMPTETVLDQCADAMAVDRHDETTYDSAEFPNVVLRGDLTAVDHCGACHEPL